MFKAQKKGIIFIAGPTGSGKSTLMNAVNKPAHHLNDEPDYDSASDPFRDMDNLDALLLEQPFDPFADLPTDSDEEAELDKIARMTSYWQDALTILLDIIQKENQALFIYQDESGLEVLENLPASKATLNHRQLSTATEVETIFKNSHPELNLDNEIIQQWSNRLDGAIWQKAYSMINSRYPQYYYAFMDYEKLSNYEVDNFEYHILAALLQIVSHSGNRLYFEHNLEGEGQMKSENPRTVKENSAKHTQYLQINDVIKCSALMKLYELGLNLHEGIIIDWLDWCINTMDDANRQKLYHFVFHNLSWQSVSPEIIRTLARRNIRDPKKIGEIITLIPACITHVPEIEMARYVNFLQDLTPEQCDNALALALFAQRTQINDSEITQQQGFFHVLKVFAADKLKDLNFITLVQHYNRTYELPSLFVAKHNTYWEIILDFNTRDIYYFLGLKESLESEITHWFNDKLINTFNQEKAKEYWKIKDVTIFNRDRANGNYSLSLIVQDESKLDNVVIEQALNEFLITLRQQNPESIYLAEYTVDEWMDKALLHYVLEKNLNQQIEGNNSNNSDTMSAQDEDAINPNKI